MADNVERSATSGGDVIAADEISGVKWQRNKVAYGPDGEANEVSPAQPFPVTDPAEELARGRITGRSPVHKFGHNSDVDSGTVPEDVWETGGLMIWPTAAGVVTVVSTSTNDDGDPTTSTGAQTFTLEGLDANWDELAETVTLNGTTPVVTSGSFIRINRAFLATTGTYHGSNEGVLTATIGGDNMLTIPIGIGQTQVGRFSVPRLHTAYCWKKDVSVASTKTATVDMYQVPNADDVSQPFGGAKRIVMRFDEVAGTANDEPKYPHTFAGKTDVWFQVVTAAANNTAVNVNFELTVIAD